MYSLDEWDTESRTEHHRNTAYHAGECHANESWFPGLPCDFQHQRRLYHFHKLECLDRVSFDSLSKCRVQRHRLAHTGMYSICYSSHLVRTIDTLCITIESLRIGVMKYFQKKMKSIDEWMVNGHFVMQQF